MHYLFTSISVKAVARFLDSVWQAEAMKDINKIIKNYLNL